MGEKMAIIHVTLSLAGATKTEENRITHRKILVPELSVFAPQQFPLIKVHLLPQHYICGVPIITGLE
jgi:hypothetical protein